MTEIAPFLKLLEAMGPAGALAYFVYIFTKKLNGKLDKIGDLAAVQSEQNRILDKLTDALRAHSDFAREQAMTIKFELERIKKTG